jgi:ribosomal-protein-alanine N-acetyltransferase
LIESKRLLIRQFEERDFNDLYYYLSKPEIYIFEPGNPISIEEATILCKERSKGKEFLAVELKQSSKMIGHLFFKQIEPIEFSTWELGYIFNPEYQRKGYGSEAAKTLVDYAFNILPIHRIMARCDPQNIASWKLLEKVGFLREAHFRQYAYFQKNSQGLPLWHDAYEYSMLRK